MALIIPIEDFRKNRQKLFSPIEKIIEHDGLLELLYSQFPKTVKLEMSLNNAWEENDKILCEEYNLFFRKGKCREIKSSFVIYRYLSDGVLEFYKVNSFVFKV